MGKHDDITPEKLRTELVRFARLVVKMEEHGVLLERSPTLLRMLGELRQMVFAYEVRCTGNLVPTEEKRKERERLRRKVRGEPREDADAAVEDSLRIVREALRRERELQDELEDGFFPPEGDHDR